MKELMTGGLELSAEAAHVVAAGMRAVAQADGNHPREEALIDAFEADLPPGSTGLDLALLDTKELKEVFLKSCVLVAFADGHVSEAELGVLRGFLETLGLGPEELGQATRDVASSLLSQFSSVQTFRDQVIEIGRSLGLDDAAIEASLND